MAYDPGNGNQLKSLVGNWVRMLDQAASGLLALGANHTMKTRLRNMVASAKSELGNMESAAARGVSSKFDVDNLKRISVKATQTLADTSKAIDTMALAVQVVARRDSSRGHLKPGADQVRRETQGMKDHLAVVAAELDSMIAAALKPEITPPEIKELKKRIPVEVKMLEPVRQLLLQQRRYVRFSIKGPAGWYAGINIEHVPSTGGHLKLVDDYKKFIDMVGDFKIVKPLNLAFKRPDKQRITFQLPKENEEVIVEFTAANLSGTFDFIIFVSETEAKKINAKLFHPYELEKSVTYAVDFIYQPGLEDLHKYQEPSLYLYQGNKENAFHPSASSHFGKPELNRKIVEVGRKFRQLYSEKQIYVNDISLPWGGTFWTYQDKEQGHKSHQKGENADISFAQLSNQEGGKNLRLQRVALDEIIHDVFKEGFYDFHGGAKKPDGSNHWHWHVSIAKLEPANGMIEGFVSHYNNVINGKYKKIGNDEIKQKQVLTRFYAELENDRFYSDFAKKINGLPKFVEVNPPIDYVRNKLSITTIPAPPDKLRVGYKRLNVKNE